MDGLTLLIDALLAIFLGSDKGYWRPDTSIFPRQGPTPEIGAQPDSIAG